jgi:hypothetical protein
MIYNDMYKIVSVSSGYKILTFVRMPYKIVPVPGGYKVKSESGTLLSKKALSRTRAEKQRVAVSLASLRSGDIKK